MLTIDGKTYDIEKMIEQADPDELLQIANLLKRLVPILKNDEGRKQLAKKLKTFNERLVVVEKGGSGVKKSIDGQDDEDDNITKDEFPSVTL